jgi:hypothetical protein
MPVHPAVGKGAYRDLGIAALGVAIGTAVFVNIRSDFRDWNCECVNRGKTTSSAGTQFLVVSCSLYPVDCFIR